MTIVILVIMVETTADILAVGEVVGTTVDNRRIARGLRADMISSAVAPVFNSFPATALAQNVGLVALTGIRSRFAVAVGGGVLAVLGLSPILAAVVGVLPLSVLAGAGIVLFGSVTASGIRTLGKVDYASNNNMIIAASAIGFGVLPIAWPEFWGNRPGLVADDLRLRDQRGSHRRVRAEPVLQRAAAGHAEGNDRLGQGPGAAGHRDRGRRAVPRRDPGGRAADDGLSAREWSDA